MCSVILRRPFDIVFAVIMVSDVPGPKRWRWGRIKGPGRPMKPRIISGLPFVKHFTPSLPKDMVSEPKPPVFLSYDEYEVLRLIDFEGLTQEEAGERMGVSRGTIWRLIKSARRKVTSALIEGREIFIVPQAPILIEKGEKKAEK